MPVTLITGANRGIGLELTRQYLADGWDVIATCRDPRSAAELSQLAGHSRQLQIEQLDVTNARDINALATRLAGRPLDVLLHNAGIIGPLPVAEHIGQQQFGSIDYGVWEQVLRTNLLAPVQLSEALLDNVANSTQRKIVAISSTVGSIVERQTPAMAYATSKTALNKAMTLLAAQLRERDIAVLIYCPGYVKTRLDFGTADVEIPASVAGLRQLIAAAKLADSGAFRRFNGDVIAW